MCVSGEPYVLNDNHFLNLNNFQKIIVITFKALDSCDRNWGHVGIPRVSKNRKYLSPAFCRSMSIVSYATLNLKFNA